MSKGKQAGPGFFGMGASLLLTVFLVLMLVTFSLLSLSTARGDLSRSQLLAQRRTDYYEANNRAETVLYQLMQGQSPEVPVTEEEGVFHYQIPMAGGQSLQVRVKADGTILRWQVEPETEER